MEDRLKIKTGQEKSSQERYFAEAEMTHLVSFPGNNPNPIVELDAHCNIQYANPAALKYFPDLVDQGKQHPLLADLECIMQRAESGSLNREINIGCLWFEQKLVCAVPAKSYLLYLWDITVRKATEIGLRQQIIELESVNKDLESFSNSVTHDLRAPLRSMDEFSLALLEDYGDKLDSEAKDYLQYIRASSQDMSQLIDDILSLSKICRVKIQLDKIDLSGLAHEVVEELKRNQPDHKVEFIIAPDLEVNGDRNLLKQVLQNLLGNSYKFTGKQNQARIEFGRANEYDEDVYFVRDNGVGFDMTYDTKLFKPFQKLHRTYEFPGSGLGLASVQRIINRLGGRVWAEGNPGQGATFCFTLSKNEQA